MFTKLDKIFTGDLTVDTYLVNVKSTVTILSIFKRWSEAESFTFFENHVYRSKKIICLPKFFAFFSNEIDSLTLNVMTTYSLFLPKFFAYFSNEIDSLTLKVMNIPYFAHFFFAFFSNEIDHLL